METKAIRKPNPSKPNRTPNDKATAPSDQEVSDRNVTQVQNSNIGLLKC